MLLTLVSRKLSIMFTISMVIWWLEEHLSISIQLVEINQILVLTSVTLFWQEAPTPQLVNTLPIGSEIIIASIGSWTIRFQVLWIWTCSESLTAVQILEVSLALKPTLNWWLSGLNWELSILLLASTMTSFLLRTSHTSSQSHMLQLFAEQCTTDTNTLASFTHASSICQTMEVLASVLSSIHSQMTPCSMIITSLPSFLPMQSRSLLIS